LVGADGIRSTVREQFLPQAQPSMPARSPGARCSTKHKYRPTPTARFSSYPVPGRNNDTAVDRRGYNIVLYRPVDLPAAGFRRHRSARR